jgi:hypothetical protein
MSDWKGELQVEGNDMNSCNGWLRVSRSRPCPVCDKLDWCLLAADGGAAICSRVESPKRCGEAGWLHRLNGHLLRQRTIVRSVRIDLAIGVSLDLARFVTGWQAAVDPGRLELLAHSLGLSMTSLCRFGIGWSEEHRAWVFPMFDPIGNVLRIRLRYPNGCKLAVRESNVGLHIPTGITFCPSERLILAEGPTDAAALLDMGFRSVVGKYSCLGNLPLLTELTRLWRPRDVVIVADGNESGRRGANNLASVLVAYGPAVRVIEPPEGVKDVRDWLRTGGGLPDVEQRIASARVQRLAISARMNGKKG